MAKVAFSGTVRRLQPAGKKDTLIILIGQKCLLDFYKYEKDDRQGIPTNPKTGTGQRSKHFRTIPCNVEKSFFFSLVDVYLD